MDTDFDSSMYKSIFENSPVSIVILDASGRILFANSTFYRVLKITSKGTPNTEFLSLIHPDYRKKLETHIKEVGAGLRSGLAATICRSVDEKKSRWLRIRASSIPAPSDAEDLRIICVVDDITEQHMAQEKLRSAKEEAEKATRIKSDFLANMSHEIRTPIHTIIGMDELLAETKLDAEQSEYIEQIGFSADVLLSLINDILDFSKIEAGKLSLETIEFDLYKTIEDSVDLVALEAHKKELEVLLAISGEVPRFVRGDPVRVRQIIVNLFNNAMKFTSSGEIGIILKKTSEDKNRSWVKISVWDSGIGIPREKMERLFGVFSQVDSSTTRKFGGSGLGLSISKNLVEMMDGQIGVESEEGKGSRFWFHLPFPLSEREIVRVRPAKPFPDIESVLVIDDSKSARKVLGAYLRELGLTVEESAGGDEGLAMIRGKAVVGEPYDLCFIDLLMPGMDGWHVASEIHSNETLSSTKLFLLSPTGKSADEAKMKLLGWFEGYLSKPLKKTEFLETLNRSLGSVEELESVDELEVPLEAEGIDASFVHTQVLVAEDHVVNQQLFRTILESFGLRVVLASNGREAVESMNPAIRMVFMDVHMPEMNGYEATRIIRSQYGEVPIIAVTASAIKGEQEKALEAGMTDFLAKPFRKRDVVPVIQRWLVSASSVSDTSPPEDSSSRENQNEAEIFNLEQAVDTFMGDRGMVLSLVKTLADKAEEHIEAIRQDLDQKDWEGVRANAHAIKGSSLNLSALRMGNAAAALELSGKEANGESALSHFADLIAAFEEFQIYSKKLTSE